jgi:AraC-like DNA-binding protein
MLWMTLTKTILFNTDILQIRYVVCNPLERGRTGVEEPSNDVLVMPVKGSFMQHFLDGTRIIAEPSQALFFQKARPFQISHSIAEKDECLAFEFSSEIWKELKQTSETVPDLALLSSPAIAQRTLLWKKLVSGWTDELEVVEKCFGLVSAALRTKTTQARSRRSEKIEVVKLVLLNAPDKKLSLCKLAILVSLSPYQLTRIFRQHVGASLHQYHLRVRMAGAIDSILDSNSDLTQIALDYGFSSHSHFTFAFRKMTGLTPADFRKAATSSLKKEMRKKLIAH